ncbi:hypothetical protein BJY52DRAFT_1230774 [Lactarius psammicola]|nr:hypothetical protein BJY52DRAFT_1230774 [Lactarius psammicola]
MSRARNGRPPVRAFSKAWYAQERNPCECKVLRLENNGPVRGDRRQSNLRRVPRWKWQSVGRKYGDTRSPGGAIRVTPSHTHASIQRVAVDGYRTRGQQKSMAPGLQRGRLARSKTSQGELRHDVVNALHNHELRDGKTTRCTQVGEKRGEVTSRKNEGGGIQAICPTRDTPWKKNPDAHREIFILVSGQEPRKNEEDVVYTALRNATTTPANLHYSESSMFSSESGDLGHGYARASGLGSADIVATTIR